MFSDHELELIRRHPTLGEFTAAALKLAGEGRTRSEIAKALGVTEHVIYGLTRRAYEYLNACHENERARHREESRR